MIANETILKRNQMTQKLTKLSFSIGHRTAFKMSKAHAMFIH